MVDRMRQPADLAGNEFWEETYYRAIRLPARPSANLPFERCLMRALEEVAPASAGAEVLEIGCAPARWLVWYSERFEAHVTGLESSSRGAAISRDNLSASGVVGSIREGDFFSANVGVFELVFSLGVIEHFDDVEAAFARHLSFVGEGGRLVIGVPNFRGLTGLFQRWGDREFLALHNTDAMVPELYRRLAHDHGLTIDAVRYLDGFDPDMVNVSRLTTRLALMPFRALRMLAPMDYVNGRFVSSYLLMAFTRR
jgi:SAM-dependent methyltransferase